MASVLFCAGPKLNLLERATVTVSGTADPLFGISGLSDGRVSNPMRFSGLGAAESVIVDLDAFADTGDFETAAGFPVGWETATAGTSTVTRTTTAGEFHDGTAAAKITGGDSGASLFKTIEVRAGELRRLSVWLKLADAADVLRIRIKNNRTGRFLNSSLAWQATTTNAYTHTGTTTYTNVTFAYTVEDFFKCGLEDLPTLTITFTVPANDTGFVDLAADFPAATLAGCFGLRVDDRCTVNWQTSSTNGSYGNSVLAGDHETGFAADQKPNLYMVRDISLFGGAHQRFHRIQFDNDTVTPAEPREIGELVLCQTTTLGRAYDWGLEITVLRDDIGNESGDGDLQAYNRSRWAKRALGMRFQHVTDAQMRENRDYLWGRAAGRKYPVLLVPDDSANLVMLARLDRSWSVQRRFTSHYTENDLTFAELPFVSTAL